MAMLPCSYCKGFSYNYSLFGCYFTIYCWEIAGVGALLVVLLVVLFHRGLVLLSCTYNPEKKYVYYVKYGYRVNPYVYLASD